MARATFVEHAARDWTEEETGIEGGIKKGSPYYWWKFKRGGKRFSLTPPRRSQLTQSAHYAAIFDMEDDIAKATAADVEDAIENAKSTLEELRDQAQESLDNMPEGLQQGSTGEMLQERVQWCDDKSSELDSIDVEDKDAALEELQGMDFTDSP